MRISIDASGLSGYKTGTAVYLVEILKVWNKNPLIDHDFVIFSNSNAYKYLSELGLDTRFKFIFSPSNRYLRVFWQQVVMPLHISRLSVDVHWGTGFALPLLSEKPMVVTIHDLTFHLFPTVHERVKCFYFPAMVRAAVRKARAVITVSESTRRDLHRLVPVDCCKSTVTPLAARKMWDIELVSPSDHGRASCGNYILFVGTVEPRKNLARLIRAWKSLDAGARSGVRLIIVGATGWNVNSWLHSLRNTEAVEFRGYLDDTELAGLLRGAMAFAYPSLYEGFGLPVVEAMSLGIPVLTSNIGATREVAEGAALLIDPMSEDDIRLGIEALIGNPGLRRSLAILGQQRASNFTWACTAERTIQLIERVAHS